MLDDLIRQLASPDPGRRREAITALANSKDPAALKSLAEVHRNDPDPDLRELALKAGRYIRQQADSAPPLAESTPAVPAPPPRASRRQVWLAKNHLDAAFYHYRREDFPRAIERLGAALDLNPALRSDEFVRNLAMLLTNRAPGDAVVLLADPEQRAALIEQLGGKARLRVRQSGKDADKATWRNNLIDLGALWAVVVIGMLALIALDLFPTLQSMSDSFAESTSGTIHLPDMRALVDARAPALIALALACGTGAVLGVVVQGALVHVAAVRLRAGIGTFAYLVRRLARFGMIVCAGGFAVMIGVLLSGTEENLYFLGPMVLAVGTVIAVTYLGTVLAQVYEFDAGDGCGALFLGSVFLAALGGLGYALARVIAGGGGG